MTSHINIVRMKAVHQALEELGDEVVFVGGAVVSLYADRRTFEVRPTDDVDILMELHTRKAFIELEENLRKKGFQNDITANFVGRYIIEGIIVDVMPNIKVSMRIQNNRIKLPT